MGYNTTVVILNDALHQISKDRSFGKNLASAISGMQYPIDVSSGNTVNAAQVVESHHADSTVIVAVGGNCATVLGIHYTFIHHTLEQKEKIIKSLAEDLGYRLVKKRKKTDVRA